MAFIQFHVQDVLGHPIGDALIQGDGLVHGHWQGLTNPCGDFHANLSPDHYDITVNAPGYDERKLPADLADGGCVTIGLESGTPGFKVAPRFWRGNMCGSRVPGLLPVSGGAEDTLLVLSWFYDRYSPTERALIRATWKAKGYTHVLLSWPDSRSFGFTPFAFKSICIELINDGFYPCVMLSAKDIDSPDVPSIIRSIEQVLPDLLGLVPMFCVGWELSLWLSPSQVQELIDYLAKRIIPTGAFHYVHFQQGYFAFQKDAPGSVTADFWNANVGKLHGVLHQRDLSWSQQEYQDRIVDCLARFSGQFGFVRDNGINGNPFDFVALEITAQPQFNGEMNEGTGDTWGRVAINTPPYDGIKVMGSGNGL